MELFDKFRSSRLCMPVGQSLMYATFNTVFKAELAVEKNCSR